MGSTRGARERPLGGSTLGGRPTIMYHYFAKPVDIPASNKLQCLIDLGFERVISAVITIHGIPYYQPGSDDERECITLIRNAMLDYPILLRSTRNEEGEYGAFLTIMDGTLYGTDLARYMEDAGYGLT